MKNLCVLQIHNDKRLFSSLKECLINLESSKTIKDTNTNKIYTEEKNIA